MTNEELITELKVKQTLAKAEYDAITKILADLEPVQKDTNDYTLDFGDLIRITRIAKGFTQYELGEAAGFSPSSANISISRIERKAKAVVSTTRLRGLCEVLDLNYELVLTKLNELK